MREHWKGAGKSMLDDPEVCKQKPESMENFVHKKYLN